MKVGILTPWHVRCGIATYSEYLAKPLSNLADVYITRLQRLGRRSVSYFETLVRRRLPETEILHVQHEYGLYQLGEGVIYSGLRAKRGIQPIVTTLHSVGEPRSDEIVVENSDAVIVHNQFCKDRLGYDCQVIPHGVDPQEPMEKEAAKKKLGLKGPVVTLFGFIGPYKGIETAIRTIGLEFPGVNLLIAGGWHIGVETAYITQLKALANSVAPGQVTWTGWVPSGDLPTVFGASDICLYPNKYMTESGALLTMIGYGRCVLARGLAPNKEREQEGTLMTFSKDAELIMNLEKLLTDPELRAIYENEAREYSLENSWENIAKKHMELYETLI